MTASNPVQPVAGPFSLPGGFAMQPRTSRPQSFCPAARRSQYFADVRKTAHKGFTPKICQAPSAPTPANPSTCRCREFPPRRVPSKHGRFHTPHCRAGQVPGAKCQGDARSAPLWRAPTPLSIFSFPQNFLQFIILPTPPASISASRDRYARPTRECRLPGSRLYRSLIASDIRQPADCARRRDTEAAALQLIA